MYVNVGSTSHMHIYRLMLGNCTANTYLLKVNNKISKKTCEICLKLTIKRPMTPIKTIMRSFYCLYCLLWIYFAIFYSVFIVDSEQVNVFPVTIYSWNHSAYPRICWPIKSYIFVDFMEQFLSSLHLLSLYTGNELFMKNNKV